MENKSPTPRVKKSGILLVILLMLSLLLSACSDEVYEEEAYYEEETSEVLVEEVEESTESVDTEEPDASGLEVVDSGFRPGENGFGFENYGNDFGPQNLTVEEMQRMFGDQVCTEFGAETCVLTPSARRWMEENNDAMDGGHCEGMATLSLLFYNNQATPADFGSGEVNALTLEDNEMLQREIAYWWATQSTYTVRENLITGTPTEILQILVDTYQNGSNDETYTIGIYQEDMSGGHAITPYAIEPQGGDVVWVMVYDNNYPGEERHLEINTAEDTWQYEAATNPQEESELYTGDASTQTLDLTPNSVRTQVQLCDFCESQYSYKAGDGLAKAAVTYNQIWMEGDAHLLITDDKGNKLGYENGKFLKQIPGATFNAIKSNSLLENDIEPIYYLPTTQPFSVIIDGDSLKTSDAVDVVMIGPGYYVGVESIYMDPGQKDILRLNPDGRLIAYKTDYSESPYLVMGLEYPEADFELAVMGSDIKPGSETMIEFDQEKGLLVLRSTSDEYGTFVIQITRIDDETEETFESDEITLEPGDIIYFSVKNWTAQSSGLEISFDDGGDGSIDEVINMADQK